MSDSAPGAVQSVRDRATEPVIRTHGLRKEFDGVIAVDGVDIELYADEVTCIIGPNGAGKTTFINLVSGTLPPTDGTVIFNGEDVTDLSESERANHGLVRSFQHPQVLQGLTVFENLNSSVVTGSNRNWDFIRPLKLDLDIEHESEEILARFGLEEYRDQTVDNIPYGVQKILDIAMSYALDPAVILLDEPTSGVSTSEKHDVMRTVIDPIRESDAGLVFIEHDMELVEEYADNVIAMHLGKILAQGGPIEVLDDEQVKENLREKGV